MELDTQLVDEGGAVPESGGVDDVVLRALDVEFEQIDSAAPDHSKDLVDRDQVDFNTASGEMRFAGHRARYMRGVDGEEEFRTSARGTKPDCKQLQTFVPQVANVSRGTRRRVEPVDRATILTDDRLGKGRVFTQADIYHHRIASEGSRRYAPAARGVAVKLERHSNLSAYARLDTDGLLAENAQRAKRLRGCLRGLADARHRSGANVFRTILL